MCARLRVLELGKYYPPYRGGMESHLRMLCDALRAEVDLTVLVAATGVRTSETLVDGVRVIRTGAVGRLCSVPICLSLPFLVSRIPADLVHIHVPNPAAILAYFAAAARKPLVISYHSDTVRQPILARIFSPILDRALRRAAAIICTSPQYRDSSPGLVGHQERCHVIPLAIDPEPLERAEPEAIAAIRSRFGPRILLAVGRLVYYKGFEYLIQSMRKVTAHLLIIGRGPLRVALGRQALQYGVADKVTFLGEVDDLAPYYHAADVFILPSIVRTEAFGVVQLEAMACGKPVINTHLDSGVPFVSIDGETGLTVPTADSGALAGAINLLLQEPGLRHQFGVAARQRVLTHFNPKTMVASTLRVFEIAMSQHRLNESARLARPVS